jgi:hypothetical protein
MIARLSGEQTRRRWGWGPLIAAGLAYAAVVCVVVAIRADSTTDFRDFWETARHFRQTGAISSELGVHNYLPFFTILMTPWSLLPLQVAIVLFTALSLGLFALTVVLVETLLNGGLGPGPRKATLAAIGLMLAYVHSCGVLGQLGLLILFLVITTWFLVERGQEWTAGLALGLATLIKLLPAVLIVFFLLKGRWRVVAGALGLLVVLGFGSPLAAIGWKRTVVQHHAFYDRAIRGHAARTTILAAKPHKAKYSNNSLPIVLRRLLSGVNGDPSESEPDRRLYVNFTELRRETIWWIYLALMGAFVLTSLGISLRGTKPPPSVPPDALAALRAQFGVWCCLMLIASPLLWTHYLVLAYWPLACVADRAERLQGAANPAGRAYLAALLVWLISVLLLAWPAARAAGAQLWAVAVLWVVLATQLLLRCQRSQAAGSRRGAGGE